MASDYSPTSADVKRVYCKAPVNLTGEEWKSVADGQFDRWLSKVKADAVREAADMVERLRPETGPQINVTQYRQGKADAVALAHAHLLAAADRIETEPS